MTDLLELISSFLHFIFNNNFEEKNGEEIPINWEGYIINLCYLFSMIISTFMNWFTFYFIVRKTFEKRDTPQQKDIDKSMILRCDYQNLEVNEKTNANIDLFLSL